jgi:acyl transferase domain-containing protein
MFSAGHPESLKSMQHNNQEYAAKHPGRLRDLAYTLSHRRERLPVRGFCITNGADDGTIHSPPFTIQSQKEVAFVFTGQGAQWAQMGKELLETCPDVLRDIRQMDEILQQQQQDNSLGWTIEKELLMPAETSRISEAEIAQPICTALQIALCNHLRRWNILPVATLGHSSGEIAAAYAAGCFDMRGAILLAYYRGVASKAQRRPGAMAAVGLGYDEVARLLKPGVVIACENSPSSVTLSGDADALKLVLAAIDKEYPQAFQRLLNVNKAYHSRQCYQTFSGAHD